MKCLHLFRVLNPSSRICCSRAIQTDGFRLARTRVRNVPRKINYEPGLRHTEAALSEDSDVLGELQSEEDLENAREATNYNEEYDMYELNEEKRRKRVHYLITANKFFRDPPQPATLSCNERECIRYLHKTDPVHWNVETLSESFPATPVAIRKVLKRKFRLSEEAKRKLDLKVQRNWELLADGKLEAAPEVLEHLKKFTNRREVLLDQIKKASFYLPEMKEQVVWNNGEMSNILDHYEKAIQKLALKQELQSNENPRNEKPEKLMLQDVEKKHNLLKSKTEFVCPDELKKVLDEIRTNTKASSSPEKEFDRETDTERFAKKNSFSDPKRLRQERFNRVSVKYSERLNTHENEFYENQVKNGEKPAFWNNSRVTHEKALKDTERFDKYNFPNSEKLTSENEHYANQIKNTSVLNKGQTNHEETVVHTETHSDTEGPGKKINPLDPERLRRENEYFANQVKDIENTAFWNKGRTSHEKALAEDNKVVLGGPDTLARGKVWISDVYPERIKIPKNKRGSGLTFRVKDCYYDDDGEFLYRVPGMVKTNKGVSGMNEKRKNVDDPDKDRDPRQNQSRTESTQTSKEDFRVTDNPTLEKLPKPKYLSTRQTELKNHPLWAEEEFVFDYEKDLIVE